MATGRSLAPDDLLQLRLANQHLANPQLSEPAAVVAHLGAVQAQDEPAARWALGQRLQGATEAGIERALDAGHILRTHVLRPTWHFVAPADIRWLLELTGPRVRQAMAFADRELGIDAAVVARSNDALARSLAGGQRLTRPELTMALRQAGLAGADDGRTVGHLLLRAEVDAVICSGPRRGKQVSYALLHERVPATPPLEREAALAELVWRYFSSHGPATASDFNWWSGLTLAETRRGLAACGPRLEQTTTGGRTYWFAPPPGPPPPVQVGPVFLLANYDEYTVAYRERDLFFDPTTARSLDRREPVPFSNVIVADGRVAGVWRRRLHRDSVVVQTVWFAAPTPGQHAGLRAAAQRYAAFLGLAEARLESVEGAPTAR